MIVYIMAEKGDLGERKRLLAASLQFEALEKPGWRKREEVSVAEMISQIMQCRKAWEEEKDTYDDDLVEKIYKEFLVLFVFHVNMEDESGFSTFEETESFLRSCYSESRGIIFKRSFSIKEQETINVKNAYQHLLEKIKKEEEPRNYGLIEASLLQETHRILMRDIPLPHSGSTKHGEFSSCPRSTIFKGQEYNYKNPPDMEVAVMELLDQCNTMFDRCVREGLKDCDDLYCLFKLCAWMLMELLDLHPFGDGNGRLCRILCSYMLSVFTPFPTPVYNVWTDSCKDDYKQALIDAREDERRPTGLTTMIIECSYYAWKKFLEALNERKKSMKSTG